MADEKERDGNRSRMLGYGIVFGAAFGMLFGQALFDSAAMGIAFGIAIGIAVAAGWSESRKAQRREPSADQSGEPPSPE